MRFDIRFGWRQTLHTSPQSKPSLKNGHTRRIEPPQEDPVPDFSKEKATTTTAAKMKMQLDRPKVENQLREWSKIFRDFPAVQTSGVSYHARLNHRYIANSEGSRTLEPQLLIALQINASTQAADGMTINLSLPFSARSFDEMPSTQDVSNAIRQMAKDVTTLRTAPPLDANYSGPLCSSVRPQRKCSHGSWRRI
jgi:predicted Zn-dependent protease